jgi:hypothetical protein
MIKKETISKKIKRVEDALTRMENGMYAGVTVGWITDTIAWLWKFRYIDYDQLTDLTARARYVIWLAGLE